MPQDLEQIGPRIAPFAKAHLADLEQKLPLKTGIDGTKEEIIGALIHVARANSALADAVTRYKRDLARWRSARSKS